jgi:exopolysaccharide production protein ExoQ
VLSILIAMGLWVLFSRKINWPEIFRNNYLLLLWVLYGGISILWSDFAGVAFKRWIKEIGTFVMVLIVITEPNPIESMKTLLRRCMYVLIPFSIILIKYYRDLGVFYSPWGGYANLAGVTTDKNGLGRLCLVSVFFFFWAIVTMRHNKNKHVGTHELLIAVLFIIMSLWLLIKVNSATSLGALLIGIAIFSLLGTGIFKRNVKYLGVFVVLVLPALFLIEWAFNLTETAVTMLGRNLTLTGRTDLWKDLVALGGSPIFGTGYDSFWIGPRLERLWQKYWWSPNEAHNGYLEVYLSLGAVGLVLLASILVSTFKKIQKNLISGDFDYARFRMAFLFILLFYNITEAAFRGMSQMWLVFLLIALEHRAVPGLAVATLPLKETIRERKKIDASYYKASF